MSGFKNREHTVHTVNNFENDDVNALSICYTNADGLLNKMDEIKLLVDEKNLI